VTHRAVPLDLPAPEPPAPAPAARPVRPAADHVSLWRRLTDAVTAAHRASVPF
jgi:hypothetical protein